MTPEVSPFTFECVLASAGSGKTFQLSNRYLALLRAGVEVDAILATTFTRAAAAEIARRVLLRLVDAAGDPAACAALAAHTGGGSFTPADAVAVLRRVTTSLHRLQIRTLDSFFSGLVTSFALELGLPPGVQLADDVQVTQLRREALRALFDAAGDDLIPLVRSLTEASGDRLVYQSIDRLVTEMHAAFVEAAPGAWDAVTPRAPLADPDAAIRSFVAFEPEGKQIAKAHAKAVEHVLAEAWPDLCNAGIAKAILQNGGKFGRSMLDPEIIARYEPILHHAQSRFAQQVAARQESMRDVLDLYDRCLEGVKRRAGILMFDDQPRVLRAADLQSKLELVRDRLDARIDHLELDEFQDTGPTQWALLRPMAEELIQAEDARETSFFCVGDVKQSIYGWRSACPEILESIPDLLRAPEHPHGPVITREMSTSWRSAPAVIEMVNHVFRHADHATVAMKNAEAIQVATKAFTDAFPTHATERTELVGYAALVEIAGDDGDDAAARKQRRIDATADEVERLHRAAPHLTIGVLARSNRMVSALLYALGPAGRDLPVSGSGGTPLTDTPAVLAILDALQLADHPGDTMARYHVGSTPLGAILGITPDLDGAALAGVARTIRRALVERGAAAVVAEWVHALRDEVDARAARRLAQLVDVIAAGEATGQRTPTELIHRVETMRVAEPRPAPIQVMTLHQSKGLEYDVVIAPDLDVDLVRATTGTVIADRADPTGPVTTIVPWMAGAKRALLPELDGLHERYVERAAREALAGLYVTLTRAQRTVLMLVDPSRKTSVAKSAASIVRGALSAVSGLDTDGAALPAGALGHPASAGTLIAAVGDPQWLDHVPGVEDVPPPESSPAPAVPRVDVAPRRAARAPSASALKRSDVPLRARLALGDRASRHVGTAVHALFEGLTWLDDAAALDRAVLERRARRAVPRATDDEIADALALYDRALTDPAIRTMLTPPAARDQVEVHLERRIAGISAGALEEGVIDRLTVTRDGDRRVAAAIIDWKTDHVPPGEADAIRARHQPQLDRYRELVARQLRLPPEAITTHCVLLRAVE